MGNSRRIVEKRNHKKYGKIISEYFITNADNFDNSAPLSFFDYSVLFVCISELLAGNNVITLAMILRGLTGKSKGSNGGYANGAVNPEQRSAIINSIKKLMSTIISYNSSDVNKKFCYDSEEIITDTILPCHFVTYKINGQIVDSTIFFDRQSPIFIVSDSRNQIIRYSVVLLDLPNQNNAPLVISLKNYLLLRVFEIKLHHMTLTITFDDLFKKARITDKPNVIKLRTRDYILKFFKHLQDNNVISSFDVIKVRNKFYGIKFTF